jgi:beta-lactamase class D
MKNNFFLYVIAALLFTSCGRKNILTQNQWGDIYKKHGIDSACFEMIDNTHDQAFIYNLERCSRRMSPASTFKVFLSLAALESNVALDENLMIAWNKIPTGKPEWDKDMTMREALKVSSEPYFKELAKKMGAVEMQKWLDTIRYGNKRIGQDIESCWVNDTLLITPDEQVGFMKKLYFDKLPMSQRSQRIVRNMLLQEETAEHKLYFKTGTKLNGNRSLVWLVGFIERKETQKGVVTKKEETNSRPYFFAMNYETAFDSLATREKRIEILKDILKERQILTSPK